MAHDFGAELRLTSAFAKTQPPSPLALAITFREYPEVTTRAELTPAGAPGAFEVRILAQHFFAGRLRRDMIFDGSVGGETVGEGSVVAVANPALALPAEVHPDSVNLHRYPTDIPARVAADFGARAPLAFRELQALVGETPSARTPAILRAVLGLAKGQLDALDDAIDLARRDYRIILETAKYEPGRN